jgi:hypothetical protein
MLEACRPSPDRVLDLYAAQDGGAMAAASRDRAAAAAESRSAGDDDEAASAGAQPDQEPAKRASDGDVRLSSRRQLSRASSARSRADLLTCVPLRRSLRRPSGGGPTRGRLTPARRAGRRRRGECAS